MLIINFKTFIPLIMLIWFEINIFASLVFKKFYAKYCVSVKTSFVWKKIKWFDWSKRYHKKKDYQDIRFMPVLKCYWGAVLYFIKVREVGIIKHLMRDAFVFQNLFLLIFNHRFEVFSLYVCQLHSLFFILFHSALR